MSEKQLFIGIDLGGTNIKGGLISHDGKIVAEKTVLTGIHSELEDALNRIADLVLNLMRVAESPEIVRGIGIGFAGLVNFDDGIFIEGPNVPNWKNVSVSAELKKRVHKPVVLDNDANLAALGEFVYGAGQGVDNMIMVTLGTGVGGGLVLNGSLYRGKKHAAGEFGHTTIRFDGPACTCGRKGCVEAYIGTYGILRRVREKLVKDRTSVLHKIQADEMEPRHVGEAADRGDVVAQQVLKETGELLGIGLANVANLLNIEKAVIGGGIANAGEWILRPAREMLQREALKMPGETVQVVPASLGNNAGTIGAAKLAMDMFEKNLIL